VNTAIALRVSARVRARRISSRLTQQQLADRLGVTRQYVNAIEHGARVPSLETLYEFAAALKSEAWDLLPSMHQLRKSA
jgi:transcriptional regulator with XRE-family HTH domain